MHGTAGMASMIMSQLAGWRVVVPSVSWSKLVDHGTTNKHVGWVLPHDTCNQGRQRRRVTDPQYIRGPPLCAVYRHPLRPVLP
jgi:hypothetical protein